MRLVEKIVGWFSTRNWGSTKAPIRIIVFSNGLNPILQFSLLLPLRSLISKNKVYLKLITEAEIVSFFQSTERNIHRLFNGSQPTHFFFSRYGGPNYKELMSYASEQNIKTIFQIDDDLLDVPSELGEHKYRFHNQPSRKESIKFLLSNSDIVIASTAVLAEKLKTYCDIKSIKVTNPFIPAFNIIPPVEKKSLRIGYMGFDHQKDFEMIAPAIVKILKKHSNTTLSLLGRIETPEILKPYKMRIKEYKPVFNYTKYLKKVHSLKWDIGLCPLTNSKFNTYKANTKWIEYSSLGIAVIASKGFVYDDCCAGSSGILASNIDEWFEAIDKLITDTKLRKSIVNNAQKKLVHSYSLDSYREFLFNLLSLKP